MAINKLTLPSKDNAVQLKINEIIDNMITDKDFVEKKNERSWTLAIQNANLGNNTWKALAYDGNKLIALSSTGYISTSTDGETWATAIQNVDLGDNSWQSLTYGNNKFVALSATGYISTSTNGETWTTAIQSAELGSNSWRALAYGGNKFIALGSTGYISTSIDGITWTTAVQDTNLGNHTWKALAYDGNKFVALSQSGYISTSIDGTTWLEATKNTNLGSSHSWYAIAYGNSTFIALALSRYVSTSTDGETWAMAVQDTNLGSRSWQSVTYNGSEFVALGQAGYISMSSSLTHILGIENSLNVGFTNNNIFELLNGTTGLIPDARLSNNIARTSDIGNGTITFMQGDVEKGTITTNQSGNTTIIFDAGGGSSYSEGLGINIANNTISIDTSVVAQLSDIPSLVGYATEFWVDNQGYLKAINSSDVTSALGYTPYNASNPDNFISSINSTDVISALGYTPYDSTNPDNFITSSDLPTNMVTTDTAQDISGRKTFLGEKAIYFKQQATSNKLGFTLYNPNNTELAALEYRPNTISGASLLALNCPQTTGGYVGFRYWGTPAVNIVAPKVATAGNYFMATHITNGTLTVTANNQGTVDISTLLPDVSGFATQTWVQNQNYLTSSALTDYVTNTSLATTLQGYVLSSDLSTTLTNYVTSSSLTTVLTGYQLLLESGTNIKTINNTSLLGSGNIDTREIYTAVFDESTFTDVQNAYNSGKIIKCDFLGNTGSVTCYLVFYDGDYFVFMGESRYREVDNIQYIFLRLDSNDNWIYWRKENADTTLSNVSSINSNSAVATALDGKVNVSDIWYDSSSSTLNIGVAQS